MAWYIPNMGYQENCLPAEQAKMGHDVRIITSGKLPPNVGFDHVIGKMYPHRIIGVGVFEEKGIPIYRLPSFEIHNQIILIGLNSKLKELKPDVVHLHGAFAPTTVCVLLSRNNHFKLFVDDHSHETNFRISSFLPRLYMSFIRFIYSRSGDKISQFLPVTHSASQIICKELRIKDEKVTLLPLGANTELFYKTIGERDNLKHELGLNTKDILLISAGKFSKDKDIHILIEALNKAIQDNSKLKLLLIGNGPSDYMTYLKGLVSKYHLDERVIIKDFVPNSELSKYFNIADVGVWPGDPSITVIEAVATGLPIIIPKDDHAYRVIIQNGAGIGFIRRDVQSLHDSIISLVNDHSLRSEVSNKCVILTKSTLSWEKIAEESIRIYSMHVSSGRPINGKCDE